MKGVTECVWVRLSMFSATLQIHNFSVITLSVAVHMDLHIHIVQHNRLSLTFNCHNTSVSDVQVGGLTK